MSVTNFAGLSLRDLEYATTVAELQHFGRAAERCGVSQAGLSEQIRKLEDMLGFPLFERTTRRVTVTPDGEVVLRQARTVLAEARVMLEMARGRGDPLAAPLRIGVISTLGPYYLPGLLWELRTRFPKLEPRFQEGQTAGLMQALLGGTLDVVLLALPAPVEAVTAAPLFFEPFRAVLPIDHPLTRQPHLTLADLAGTGLLLLEEGHCLRDQALALCGMQQGGSRLAASLEMLRHMIAAGEGYSLLPALAIRDRTDLNGPLQIRDLDGTVGRTIGLAWRQSDPRAEAFQVLAAFLRETRPPGTQAAEGVSLVPPRSPPGRRAAGSGRPGSP